MCIGSETNARALSSDGTLGGTHNIPATTAEVVLLINLPIYIYNNCGGGTSIPHAPYGGGRSVVEKSYRQPQLLPTPTDRPSSWSFFRDREDAFILPALLLEVCVAAYLVIVLVVCASSTASLV